MRRPFRNIGLLLATTAWFASITLWMRSYRFAEAIEVVLPHASGLATIHPGRLRISWPASLEDHAPQRFLIQPSTTIRSNQSWAPAAGVESDGAARPAFLHGVDHIAGRAIRYVQIPLWALTAATGIWPALAAVNWLWKSVRRRSKQVCLRCGYDLRATPLRCPECGAVPLPRRWPVLWARRLAGIALLTGFPLACLWAGRHDFRMTGLRPMTFALLGGFQLDQQKGTLFDIPLRLRQLDGQRVAISGYMIPLDQAEDIRDFALVENLFGRVPPPVQGVVVVHVPADKHLTYFPDRLRVVGTLHVRVAYDDGYLLSVYEMTLDHAEPADNPSH